MMRILQPVLPGKRGFASSASAGTKLTASSVERMYLIQLRAQLRLQPVNEMSNIGGGIFADFLPIKFRKHHLGFRGILQILVYIQKSNAELFSVVIRDFNDILPMTAAVFNILDLTGKAFSSMVSMILSSRSISYFSRMTSFILSYSFSRCSGASARAIESICKNKFFQSNAEAFQPSCKISFSLKSSSLSPDPVMQS